MKTRVILKWEMDIPSDVEWTDLDRENISEMGFERWLLQRMENSAQNDGIANFKTERVTMPVKGYTSFFEREGDHWRGHFDGGAEPEPIIGTFDEVLKQLEDSVECPGCGCTMGHAIQDGCDHPRGCGWMRTQVE